MFSQYNAIFMASGLVPKTVNTVILFNTVLEFMQVGVLRAQRSILKSEPACRSQLNKILISYEFCQQQDPHIETVYAVQVIKEGEVNSDWNSNNILLLAAILFRYASAVHTDQHPKY